MVAHVQTLEMVIMTVYAPLAMMERAVRTKWMCAGMLTAVGMVTVNQTPTLAVSATRATLGHSVTILLRMKPTLCAGMSTAVGMVTVSRTPTLPVSATRATLGRSVTILFRMKPTQEAPRHKVRNQSVHLAGSSLFVCLQILV